VFRKSQIALEYCFRQKESDPDCSVFWVQAATVARFEETYKRIATECRIVTQEATQIDVTLLVKDWLETRHEGRWLMVVDNVDDADVFFRELTGNKKTLSQYIPRTGKGSLLFTTRSRDIAVDLILPATPISIPVLTKSEGRQLLCSRITGDHSEESVVELLEELEYIPLAITQAAAFMSKRRRTISQYLELYRKSDSARVRMLSYEFSDHARQYNSMESVAKTWIISFESIRRGNPRSADLLSLMCCFDRHTIPSALLYEEEEDILDFEDAVSVLCAFSLIESDEAGTSFDMHNLVQLATKLWLIDEKKGEEDKWAFEALKSLARNFPAPLHHVTPEYWKLCGDFLPHAQIILAHPFKSQREEIDLARAALLLSVSFYLKWRGAYMESKVKIEESFKIRERILGERHPDTLKSLGQLGWSCLPIPGSQHKSEEACRRCLELRREVLGEDHPETIDCLSDLAGAIQLQGRFQESEKMHRQAFESSKRVLGPEHLDTLNCLSGLGSVLDDLEAYEEAETALRKVVQIKIRLLGEESSSVLSDWGNLGLTLFNQKKNDEAEEVFKRVLELKAKVYGKTHPETIITLGNLILLFECEMKYESIREFSRWFSEEPKPVYSNYDPASRLGHSSLRVLKRFSFQVPDYLSSSSSSSSYSDDEEEGEVIEGSDEEKRTDNH
jgi:tetratricopeptide (TPR) repeat protein